LKVVPVLKNVSDENLTKLLVHTSPLLFGIPTLSKQTYVLASLYYLGSFAIAVFASHRNPATRIAQSTPVFGSSNTAAV
jgi:preprotein translocase subunit SecG